MMKLGQGVVESNAPSPVETILLAFPTVNTNLSLGLQYGAERLSE
jgi:hypothetical protein